MLKSHCYEDNGVLSGNSENYGNKFEAMIFNIKYFFQKGILNIALIEELQEKNGTDILEQNEKGSVTGEMSENIVMI